MARRKADAPDRPRKKGPPSEGDREFVRLNPDLPDGEIASRLNRSPEFVKRVRASLPARESLGRVEDAKLAVRAELKNSERWKRLKDEFTKDEIRFFEEEFVLLMTQFRNDITTTEHIQVFDVIKLDILAGRNLAKCKLARDDIARQQRDRDYLAGRRDELEREDQDRLDMLDKMIHEARDAETSFSLEYGKLQERKDALIKSLKATRDQRIKELHEPKDTVLGLIKRMQSEEFRAREGRELGLARLAAQKEYDRLGEVHVYENGEADRPMLSPETIGVDEK